MPRTRLSRGLLSLVVALSLAMPAVAPVLAAEADARPYVVVMAQEPIAAYDGGVAGLAADEGGTGSQGRSGECGRGAGTAPTCAASTTPRFARAAPA